MKKIVVSCFLVVGFFLVKGQVLLRVQMPSIGLVLKSQLWNLSLVNTSSQAMNIQVEMSMTNASDNQKVLSGITRIIHITKGIYQISPTNVAPVSYNIYSPNYNINISQEGFLPVGIYNVCYTIISIQNDAVERMAEECETVEIEPISPPLLISPGEDEYSELGRPLFHWLPPTPVSLFNNLVYDYILVAVEGTQNASAAIQQNTPLHSNTNIPVTNLQYPLSLPGLDTSKTYAWQVTAKSANNAIAKSDIWTFRIKHHVKETIKKPSADYYGKLKKEPDASYIVCYGILNYSYTNEINDRNIFIKVLDVTNAKKREIILDSSSASMQYGENFKTIDFTSQNSLSDRHIYLLELTNSNEERWYLKFEYRKPN